MDTPTFGGHLSMVAKGRDVVIAVIRSWNEAVRAVALPRPVEFVGTGYDLTEKLLASRRHFAEELMKVAAEPAVRA